MKERERGKIEEGKKMNRRQFECEGKTKTREKRWKEDKETILGEREGK